MDILAFPGKVETGNPVHLSLLEVVHYHISQNDFAQLSAFGKHFDKAGVGHSLLKIPKMHKIDRTRRRIEYEIPNILIAISFCCPDCLNETREELVVFDIQRQHTANYGNSNCA